jgi:hypothetical protein
MTEGRHFIASLDALLLRNNPWISLVPPMPHNGRGFDITIDWSIDEDTTRVAKYIIEQCVQEIPKTMTCNTSSLRDDLVIQRLACSLSSF